MKKLKLFVAGLILFAITLATPTAVFASPPPGQCDPNQTNCVEGGLVIIYLSATGVGTCSWTTTINWGDNTGSQSVNYIGNIGPAVSHQYARPGVYKTTVNTLGTPISDNTTCGTLDTTYTFIYPTKAAQKGKAHIVLLIAGKAAKHNPNFVDGYLIPSNAIYTNSNGAADN